MNPSEEAERRFLEEIRNQVNSGVVRKPSQRTARPSSSETAQNDPIESFPVASYIGPEWLMPEERKIRVLADGRWIVYLKTGGENYAWHKHKDYTDLIESFGAILDTYLGRDIAIPLKEGVEEQISTKPTLSDIGEELEGIADPGSTDIQAQRYRQIIIPGEIEKVGSIGREIQIAIANISSGRLTTEEKKELLTEIGLKIGRVRNDYKKRAKAKLLDSGSDNANLLQEALDSFDLLLQRSAECVSISSAILERGNEAIEFETNQYVKLSNWTYYLEQARKAIPDEQMLKEGYTLTESTRQDWVSYFTNGSMIESLEGLHGAPYSNLSRNTAIRRLARGEETLTTGDYGELRELFGNALKALRKPEEQRVDLMRKGFLRRFRTRSQIEEDKQRVRDYDEREGIN